MQKNRYLFLVLLLPFFISLSCVKSRLAPEVIENISADKKEIEVREGEISTFTITSYSKRDLNFTVTQLYSALDISPKSGVIKNNKQAFNVTIDKNAHLNGFYNLPITVSTELGDIIINTKVYTGNKYFLQFPDSIIIEMNTNKSFLSLQNNSLKSIPFEIVGDTLLNIIPTKDSIAPSQTKNIPFTINRLGLANGTYFGKINLKAGINQYSIFYRIEHFLERKIPLAVNNIIDADYCRANDRMVLASQDPNQLLVFDTDKQLLKTIDLPSSPNCVSISPDGKYAAVGGYGEMFYLDLTSGKIIKTYPLTFENVFDIIISNTNIIYYSVFNGVKSLNLFDDSTSFEIIPNAQNSPLIKMHPNGKFIYAHVSGESNFHKFDIQSNKPQYLYETSNIRLDNNVGNFGFNNTGTKIISSNKYAMNTSENKDLDLISTKMIRDGFSSNFRSIDIFGDNFLYMLSEENSSLLGIFNINNMTYTKDMIHLEKYLTTINGKQQFLESDGQFVFVNSTGNKTLVISKIKANFIPNRWGIELIDN